MNEIWTAFAAWLVATPLVAVLFAFLARTYINHRLAKELESYRASLDEQAERLKTQLSIRAHEESLTLSRVDAEKSRAIGEIWRAMRKLQNNIARIQTRAADREGDAKLRIKSLASDVEQVLNHAADLFRALTDNAIYLRSDSIALMGSFARDAKSAVSPVLDRIVADRETGVSGDDLWRGVASVRDQALRDVAKLDPKTYQLAAELRQLLGTDRTGSSVDVTAADPSAPIV
jgi:uncharacterized membrane-anchored protein YhcB (DUF1043 family)